jgi:hypothetical protein
MTRRAPMKQVTIISTLDHNVGDDFVRDGIVYLLGKILGSMELQLIHKHLPITARPEFSWIHSSGIDGRLDRMSQNFSLRSTRRIDSYLPLRSSTDRIRTADILVQSGGPVYWANADGDCSDTEWWDPLITRRWLPNPQQKPFLNLAGGTCQRYDSDGSEFLAHPKALDHIRHFFDISTLTTVRDELSVNVLRQAGRQVTLLPCTSIFAVDRLSITPSLGDFVVLNYMPAGGHFLLGQRIDAEQWERRFVEFARRLSKRQRVIMVCHNAKELEASKRLLPEFELFYSADYREYLHLYSRARWGILNRVHGCFALASLGKPGAVIGSDSRSRMVQLLGLPEQFVNDATDDWLNSTADHLDQISATFPDQMRALKESTMSKYISLIQHSLARVKD